MTDDLVTKVDTAVQAERAALDPGLVLDAERPGLWPDQLSEDPVEPGDDPDDAEEATLTTRLAPINRIYYGPPGTGKTYQLQQLLADQYTHEVVTGDVAEWTAQRIATEIGSLTWWEALAATLYDIKGPAKVAQIIDHPFIKSIIAAKARTKNIHQTVWGTLQEHTVEESKTVKQAEAFFSRLRRYYLGISHKCEPKYLADIAWEMAWREDVRRKTEGEKSAHLLKTTSANGRSIKWRGYWQKRKVQAAPPPSSSPSASAASAS